MVVLFRKDGRVDVLSGWGTKTQSLNDASVQLTSGESDAHVAALLDIFARYQAASLPVDMQARRAEPTATWPASYALT
jgi:hypothetical protein